MSKQPYETDEVGSAGLHTACGVRHRMPRYYKRMAEHLTVARILLLKAGIVMTAGLTDDPRSAPLHQPRMYQAFYPSSVHQRTNLAIVVEHYYFVGQRT